MRSTAGSRRFEPRSDDPAGDTRESNLEADEAHELERVAAGYDAIAEFVIEAHLSRFDIILEMNVAHRRSQRAGTSR